MSSLSKRYDDEKRELIEEYIDIENQKSEIDKELEKQKQSTTEESSEDEESEKAETADESFEEEHEVSEEQEDESEEEDDEDESEEDDDEDESEEDDDEDDKSDDNKKDNVNSEGKIDSEGRRKLGPNNEDRKVDLDDYKKPSNLAEKGSDFIKGKAGETKSNIARNLGRAKTAVTTAFSAVKGVAVGAVKLLANPMFWMALVAVTIFALTFFIISSSLAVFGGNDYNKLCDQNGVGGVMVDDDVDDLTRQSAIASWLMSTPFKALNDQPMSREQAVAVIGNFKLESSMANPKAIGGIGDWNVEMWKQCDNNCVKNSTMGSNPVGLAQHLGGRRAQLVSMAEAAGVQWYDLNIQLEHLKAELDGEGQPSNPTYEMNQVKKNFAKPGLTVEEYTWYWQKDYERAGETRNSGEMTLRQRYAQEFDEQFTGASAALSSQCSGGLSIASNVTELAAQIAWTREEKSAGIGYGSCGASPGCGETFSKPEYIELKARVEEETGRDGNNIRGLLASCDALVATLVRGSGIDENIPYHDTSNQVSYLDNPSNGWERVSCQSRQPGDVFGKPGHIMIYVGEIDGKDTMVSASISGSGPGRSAHMANISCNGNKFHGDGMTVQGWRKVQ